MAQFTVIKLNEYRCGSSVEVDLGSEFLTPNLDPGFLGINWWLVRAYIEGVQGQWVTPPQAGNN